MISQAGEDDIQRRLRERLSPAHLRLRLGIERDHEHRVFGQGRNLFHIENWQAARSLISGVFRLSGLYRRARRNALRLRVVHNRVRLRELPQAFHGFRILHLSDLHLDMSEAFPHVLGEVVRELDYDLCVMTGDYRARTHGPIEPVLAAMERLCVQLREPIYAVLGNHDSIRLVPGLEGLGLRMLLNEGETLERDGQRIHLAGLDDPHYYRADNLEKVCTALDDDGAPRILLAHTPEIYRHAAHAGFELMLCGHTHGGQICLPGGVPILRNARCPRRYCAGPWRYREMAGYTSVGAGSSIVPLRLNCPPEVTIHELLPLSGTGAEAGA